MAAAASGRPTSLTLRSTKSPSASFALTNKVCVHPADAQRLTPSSNRFGLPLTNYCEVKGFVYNFEGLPSVPEGEIGFSMVQRNTLYVPLNEPLAVSQWAPTTKNVYASTIKLELAYLSQPRTNVVDEFDCDALRDTVLKHFVNQAFTVEQKIAAELACKPSGMKTMCFRVVEVECAELAALAAASAGGDGAPAAGVASRVGVLLKNTVLQFTKAQGAPIKLAGGTGPGGSMHQQTLFAKDFSFEKLGIGGLDEELGNIFRRAFASRIFPPSVVTKLGINHVRGLLLFGPPGTGKTLIARQIGKMLNGKEPKVVTGPEILNKFVGQSEENVRALFADAEKEYKERGDESDLHIIIFDEIDAICKQRGSRSGDTGVGDSVVNQLLAKIDGVDSLNNILVIGMTNRKDMIDEALMRPGRLEVQVEIGLPSEKGRLQIVRIHTAKMVANKLLDADVDLEELSARTKNFSGAEIEGLVKSAVSFAFRRHTDPDDLQKSIDTEKIRINRADFLAAIGEVKPIFGVQAPQFEQCLRAGFYNYGASFDRLLKAGTMFVDQVKHSARSSLVTVLLEGPPGVGKTALAATLAMRSDFPFIKLIQPEDMIGYHEAGKVQNMYKVFEDAYKSPLSVIVVDDIERLLDYVRIGPRFSNTVLQALLVLLKKPPPKGRRLLIIGTTSSHAVLEDMEITNAFNAVVPLSPLARGAEVRAVLAQVELFSDAELATIEQEFSGEIPIKKLLMVAEMARQGEGNAIDRFRQCMADYGIEQLLRR